LSQAAGFIGSHFVEALAREDAQVRAFARYNSRNDYGWLEDLAPELLERVEIFRGDLCNPEAVANALEGVDTVFHLGAVIPIPYSYLHPREFVETNVVGTLNVLEAGRRAATVRRIVHTSTSEVYGTPERVPISEMHRLRPQSPCAASKVGADQMAASYVASFELPVVTARPFDTYGPRQSARAIIPTIISQALLRGRDRARLSRDDAGLPLRRRHGLRDAEPGRDAGNRGRAGQPRYRRRDVNWRPRRDDSKNA
jgi:dTDP-glucose 4,6-dehydratase